MSNTGEPEPEPVSPINLDLACALMVPTRLDQAYSIILEVAKGLVEKKDLELNPEIDGLLEAMRLLREMLPWLPFARAFQALRCIVSSN